MYTAGIVGNPVMELIVSECVTYPQRKDFEHHNQVNDFFILTVCQS